MDEKDFELLGVLNSTKNITRAAEQLFITQSALSKRVKAMEEELGAELMIRSRQGVRFTPAGEAVLARSAAAAQQLEEMRRELDSMRGGVCGTLNAGISVNFAQYRLPDILAEYHALYPRVRLSITTGHSRDLYRRMTDGSLDIAVIRGEYPWDGERFMLSQENVCVICSGEHADTPLSDFTYISHKTDISQSMLVARWLHEQGLDPRGSGFCVDSISTCMEMVRRGLGWGIIPEIALKGFDGVARACRFKDGEPFVRKTYILCTDDAARLPQVSVFIDLLKKR